MSKRRRKKGPGRLPAGSTSEYRQNVRQADATLSRNRIDLRPDNWQQLVLKWITTEGPDRREMARYIEAHEGQLGVGWAREMLRLEVFFQVQDHAQISNHYRYALSRYPRCALVEMWVADSFFRFLGDFWQARSMYQYAADRFLEHPKPCYELGFMHYLLGDFTGALSWFSQAVSRVADGDVEMGSRVFYNRGLMRYIVEDDKKAAIADIREALRRRPNYPQAREALRALRSQRQDIRWVPW